LTPCPFAERARPEREAERDPDAERRQRVDGLRVEVGLVDDVRRCDDGAEDGADDRRCHGHAGRAQALCRQRDHGQRS